METIYNVLLFMADLSVFVGWHGKVPVEVFDFCKEFVYYSF